MSAEPLVPALRFPEFRGAWREFRLEGLGHKNGLQTGPFGSQLKAEDYVWDADSVPVVMPKDIQNGIICSEGVARTSIEKASSLIRHYLKCGDILFPRRGELGRIALVSKENVGWLCGTGCLRFRPDNKKIKSNFLISWLQQSYVVNWLESNAVGQTLLNLNTEILSGLIVRVPSIEEQQKIANFLDAVSKKIALLTEKKQGLEDYKRGLMQQLFSQKLRFTRPDGSAYLDWKNKKLGSVFSWVKTNNLSREYLTDDPISGIQNIHYGDIHKKYHSAFFQENEDIPYLSKCNPLSKINENEYVKLGDVLIADASEDYADIGKSVEVLQVESRTLISGLHTYMARPKVGAFVSGFVGYLLQSPKVRKQIWRIAQGISVLSITRGCLGDIELCIPHADEQKKIAEVLLSLDKKIDAVAELIENMETFKKGLLQKLFV